MQVLAWQNRKDGMDLLVRHIKQSQLPVWVHSDKLKAESDGAGDATGEGALATTASVSSALQEAGEEGRKAAAAAVPHAASAAANAAQQHPGANGTATEEQSTAARSAPAAEPAGPAPDGTASVKLEPHEQQGGVGPASTAARESENGLPSPVKMEEDQALDAGRLDSSGKKRPRSNGVQAELIKANGDIKQEHIKAEDLDANGLPIKRVRQTEGGPEESRVAALEAADTRAAEDEAKMVGTGDVSDWTGLNSGLPVSHVAGVANGTTAAAADTVQVTVDSGARLITKTCNKTYQQH